MNLTSPAPVSPSTRLDDTSLDLRVNQRLNAEVLRISDGKITLAIQGVQVVARLSSTEQAALLVERQFAQFIVRDISGQNITLQVIPPKSESNALAVINGNHLTSGILEEAGLPVSAENLQLARAALTQGLAVSGNLLEEMRTALSALGRWDDTSLQTAAALKAAGLPLTSGALLQALKPHTELTDLYRPLLANLRDFVAGRAPPETLVLAQTLLANLQNLPLVGSSASGDLAGRLQQWALLFGKPLENLIQKQIESGKTSEDLAAPDRTLLGLAQLRAKLNEGNDRSLASAIDRFIESTHWSQILNLPADPAPDRGQWIGLNFPIQWSNSSRDLHPAYLHIARDADPAHPEVQSQYTRLVIQVELSAGNLLQVDLSIVEHQIGAEITTGNQTVREIARAELPGLQTGLESLGYHLVSSQVNIGRPMAMSEFELPQPMIEDVVSVDLHA